MEINISFSFFFSFPWCFQEELRGKLILLNRGCKSIQGKLVKIKEYKINEDLKQRFNFPLNKTFLNNRSHLIY